MFSRQPRRRHPRLRSVLPRRTDAARPHRPPIAPTPRLESLEPRTLLSAVPYGADFRDNSEFMLGDIFVNVVLLESDGSIDPNQEDWTTAEIESVKAEIAEGAQWWRDTLAAQFPNSPHTLNFTFDFTYADAPIATGYEPINQSSDDEALWIDDFLDHVGYNSGNSIFSDLDRYNHDQRVEHGTHWAFTAFVVDSTVDTNGRFADGFGSYAYHGGPFMMLTLDNQGWGLDRMGHMFAHELAHVFYALDEYPGVDSYFEHSGYHNTQNLNSAKDHPDPDSRVASIMAEASKLTDAWENHTSSPTSFEMIGWKDSDGDGVFDVLDVPLTLTGSTAFDSDAGIVTFDGVSRVNALPNQNPQGQGHDITINTVDTLQYRIDDGEWINASSYGEYELNVNAAIDVTHLSGGEHTIEWRTINADTGVTSNVITQRLTTPATTVNVVINGGDAQRSVVTSISLTLTAPPAAGDITLVNLTTGEVVAASDMAVTFDADTQTATWTFPGLTGGTLVDGNYELRPANNAAFTFNPIDLHRLFGDRDGDRDVDTLDLFAFRETLQATADNPAYDDVFDSDADGDVDFLDLTRFRVNFQTTLAPPVIVAATATNTDPTSGAGPTSAESDPGTMSAKTDADTMTDGDSTAAPGAGTMTVGDSTSHAGPLANNDKPSRHVANPALLAARQALAAWHAHRTDPAPALARAIPLRVFQPVNESDTDTPSLHRLPRA